VGDPRDGVPHTARELIHRASELKFDVLAITNHDQVFDTAGVRSFAESKGILLIPGMERTIRRKHVLIINSDARVESIRDFDDLRTLKDRGAAIIAPHPYFPGPTSLGNLFDVNIDLFDGIEYSFFYHRWFNFNEPAVRMAEKNGLRLVGNSDCHNLKNLGRTFSLLRSEKTPQAVVDTLRSGAIQVRTRPLTTPALTGMCIRIVAGDLWKFVCGKRDKDPSGNIEEYRGRLKG